MVYESDFYTTRRPYRASPSVSSYTVSTIVPSRQIRIYPGIGKVHVVHSYERLIPYIGHKRLTVVSAPPHHYRVRPSVIVREIDRITNKARPYIYYTPSLVHSEPITFFDNEARCIRYQSNNLLRTIHASVPRVHSPWPITATKVRYHYEFPSALPSSARITSPDDYIHRILTPIRNVYDDIYNISHYNTPLKKYLGPMSYLSCVRYSGGNPYSRRRNLTLHEIYSMQNDTVRNDIQLLSYYIRANKDRKAREGTMKASAALDSNRPSRHFSKPTMMLEPSEEIKQLREERAERFKKIHDVEDKPTAVAVEDAGAKIKRSTKKQEEERALAEEKARKAETAKKEQAKKEEEARRAELARQEALAAQAAAERQAEIERKAELARQEELAKKAEKERKAEEARLAAEKAAEEARIAAEQAEQARLEEEKRQAELAKQEEERQQLLRLEEIARQAEEEKENELARQAEELAELARQEAEIAEQARKEAELAELAKQEAELAELERQEKELAELDKQDREAADAAKQESELEEQAAENAEVAAAESNIPTTEEESSGPEPTASEDEPITSDPEAGVSEPEAAAEADVTGSETEPEPVIEEPETPDAEE